MASRFIEKPDHFIFREAGRVTIDYNEDFFLWDGQTRAANADGPTCEPPEDPATYPEDAVCEPGDVGPMESLTINFEPIDF